MDGFVKVLKKNNLNDIKRYFFYLTYNNRADLRTIFNKPNINEIPEVNDFIFNGKINNKNTLKLETPYSSYYTFRNELNKEWKSDRIKQIELIMSYSRVVNEFMFTVLGQSNWENEYQEIILKIMKKYFSNNRHILCYFHKFDSSGYRYHSHILLYPYENNKKGFPMIYNHIEPSKLKLIKEDFQKELEDLVKKKREIIRKKIVSIVNEENKNKENISENKIFNSFLEKNKMIKNLFL